MTRFKTHLRIFLVLSVLGSAGFASAQTADPTVHVGVLTDMAGTYADVSGQGSVIAAQMASEFRPPET